MIPETPGASVNEYAGWPGAMVLTYQLPDEAQMGQIGFVHLLPGISAVGHLPLVLISALDQSGRSVPLTPAHCAHLAAALTEAAETATGWAMQQRLGS